MKAWRTLLFLILGGCAPEPKTPRDKALHECWVEACADFQIYQDLDRATGVYDVCRIQKGYPR